MHRNENTSVVAARSFVTIRGGSVSWLEQTNSTPARLITFSCAQTNFTFDPNRMFTRAGAEASLLLYSPIAPQLAVDAVYAFGQALLTAFDFDGRSVVIAIHNNGGRCVCVCRSEPVSSES